MGEGKPSAGPFWLFPFNRILVLLLTCFHQDTTVISQPCCNFTATQRMKIGQLSVAPHCFLCKSSSADASELKRLYCVLDKVLVCLCRFWFTHRSLRARGVCLLAAAEFRPELNLPKPHQTLPRYIYDAVAIDSKLKTRSTKNEK